MVRAKICREDAVKPQILERETLYSGWNRMLMVTATTARGSRLKRSVEDHGNAVAVLPFDAGRKVALLVRQLRVAALVGHGVDASLEAPAGILDEDDPQACARREAMEEAGLRLGALIPLGPTFPMPGISTERIDMFLAEYDAADRVAAGGGLAEETEEIEVVELPLATLADMADRGDLHDLKTYAMLQALRLKRPELF